MVGKKPRGLSWWVFALMVPKVGPMDLGTCAGLGGIRFISAGEREASFFQHCGTLGRKKTQATQGQV